MLPADDLAIKEWSSCPKWGGVVVVVVVVEWYVGGGCSPHLTPRHQIKCPWLLYGTALC